MNDKLFHIILRTLFVISAVLFLFAIYDSILFSFGWYMAWLPYTPWRILELAVVLQIFVIALLLRQIRDELRKTSNS